MSTFLRHLNNRNLQSLPFTQIFRRFSSSSSSITTSTKEFSSLSEYLSKSLGFSEQQSLLTCTKLARFWRFGGEKKVSDFNFAANAISVVDFFKQFGFNDTHIRKIVSSHPRILSSKVDKTLKPKIKLLRDLGFSGYDVIEVISANCKLLWCGLNSSILPTILSLRQILSCDDDVILVIKRSNWRHVSDGGKHLAVNVALLENSGISIESIRKILMSRPGLFLRSSDSFEDLVTRVETKLGIPRNSGVFLSGLKLLNSLREMTIESKCRVFKSFGWTQSDIETIIRVHPCCLMFSEQRLEKSLNFLMKELGYEPKYLVTRPVLLSYGVEKRLLPRYRILSVLKEKGLVRMDYPLYSAVQLTESPFLRRFVIPYKEVHELYTKHTGCNIRVQTDTNVKDDL
ncbi:hypothetical protein RND81_04G127100 [Saponaria officinalis]|uniref:Uncharacterized protein n=1 Tax=Saponaria officinalis TaxID=3572 RepID=A0AAW1LL14_SAPOF